ncbi:hypothetical protein G6011_11050 [Alternaria panax]|uniref:Uncharacterized protein n=1 Tax=Alternaria panax TaxID=48097 RepID=A0AAD4IDA6_9PLEO|nr:hypothetical protein G6011_11050 [Alternaria panax]
MVQPRLQGLPINQHLIDSAFPYSKQQAGRDRVQTVAEGPENQNEGTKHGRCDLAPDQSTITIWPASQSCPVSYLPSTDQNCSSRRRGQTSRRNSQDYPPSLTSNTTLAPKKSLSASIRSPTAQPQLQYQYATIQNKLDQINSTCAPYIDVEAADPLDLTFAKIVEQTKAFAFDLQVWAHVANIEGMARVDSRKREIVDAASLSLYSLLDQITSLDDACPRTKPRDLKSRALPEGDDDNLFKDGDDDGREADPTETLVSIIYFSLRSIELQIQNLKRLSRTLQEATPDAKDEVMAVGRLLAETVEYFGSQEALSRYLINEKISGGRGLEEGRHANSR